jgi:hypothetical protein
VKPEPLGCGGVLIAAIPASDGKFQGKVIVSESIIVDRRGYVYLCPERDESEAAAMDRARAFVEMTFPRPE